jgi:hypothetical protein
MSMQLTGVSNLNKQGTIHIAETTESNYYYGDVNDTAQGENAVYRCAVPTLPRFEKYKSVEVMNMGPDSVLEYHYIPITNSSLIRDYHTPATRSTSGVLNFAAPVGKVFTCIIRGAATGTTIRVRYEVTFECDISTNYINDYPPEYSRCFVDSEPTICMLNQNPDYTLRINNKQGHINQVLYKEIVTNKVVKEQDPLSSVNLYPQMNPKTKAMVA